MFVSELFSIRCIKRGPQVSNLHPAWRYICFPIRYLKRSTRESHLGLRRLWSLRRLRQHDLHSVYRKRATAHTQDIIFTGSGTIRGLRHVTCQSRMYQNV